MQVTKGRIAQTGPKFTMNLNKLKNNIVNLWASWVSREGPAMKALDAPKTAGRLIYSMKAPQFNWSTKSSLRRISTTIMKLDLRQVCQTWAQELPCLNTCINLAVSLTPRKITNWICRKHKLLSLLWHVSTIGPLLWRSLLPSLVTKMLRTGLKWPLPIALTMKATQRSASTFLINRTTLKWHVLKS